jgi:hypothetical protein
MIVALLLGAIPANAATRVALVIGNSAYQNVPFLPNPVNDASDLSASLKRLSFDVRTLTNARYDDMRRALIDFGQQARGAEIAVIFFAGHGIQIGGENWLIPVDAQLATDLNVANETIGLQSLTRAVSNTTKLGLVMLDACRSNPFLPKMQSTNLSRAVERGFMRVEPSDNVLVAYAARDGTTAGDGLGRNSPFTSSLLKNIETPGLEVRFLFANVRDEVMTATQRQQQPFVYGSLSRNEIFLRNPIPGGKIADSSSDDEIAWSFVQNTTDTTLLTEFIRRFPQSKRRIDAEARLMEIYHAGPPVPLPTEISVDPAILQLIETHPFFAKAVRVSASSYNVESNSRSTVNGFNIITDSNDDTSLRWLRPGIAQFDTTQSMRQKNSGATSSVIKSTFLGAANGFVSLGYRSSSTMRLTTQREPMVNTSGERLTSLSNLTGHIFPIEVGGQYSYQADYQTTSSSMPGDEKTLDESCEVTKRYEAKSFNPRLTGAAYLVTCDQRTVYKRTKTNNSNSQSKTVYFDALGICIRADSVEPSERTVQTYFGGNASEANILKSFVATNRQ